MAAVELLALANTALSATDAPMLRESGFWALVDPLAFSVVGAPAAREPAAFWRYRAALGA